MVFRHHKRVVLALLLMELALLRWPVLEYSYGLYAVVALIYFGVTYWFVFGVRKWWLYQFAGIAYVGYLTLAMLAPQIFAPSSRFWYHLILAGLWAVVLAIHLFVERELPPSSTPPPPPRDDRYFPD